MTHFTKQNLRKSGQYLLYITPDTGTTAPKFVARFKHKGPVTMAIFKQELIKNHTVESYFDELEVQSKAPLAILREHNPSWYQSILDKWKCDFKFNF